MTSIPDDIHEKTILTPRLRLVPATASLVRAEMEDRPRFFRLLGVHPSPDWPPDEIEDALPIFREELESRPHLAGSRGRQPMVSWRSGITC